MAWPASLQVSSVVGVGLIGNGRISRQRDDRQVETCSDRANGFEGRPAEATALPRQL
jgi:hypothetical protein